MQKFSRISVSVATIGMVASLGVTTGAGQAGAATASSWQQLAQGGVQPAMGSALAYDDAHHQELLFGGTNKNGSFSGTWTWSGSAWNPVNPTNIPSPRSFTQTAYDAQTGNIVLFGGQNGAGNATLLNDTWIWNGSDWSNRTVAGPSNRAFGATAYDPNTGGGQVVLFGGQSGVVTQSNPNPSTPYDDTWAWNGSAWTQLSPTTSPSARYGASMAYDPSIGKTILFGGTDPTNPTTSVFADTWAWTGTNWSQLSPTKSPPARYGASMAYDPAIGDLVLYGGVDASGNVLSDTWIFDGVNWMQVSSASPPGPRFAPAASYDGATGQTLLFGGQDSNGNYLQDTWNYQTVQLPPPATAPGAPSGLTASGGDGQATLDWTAPSSDGGSAITGYNVYEGTAAGGESTTPVNSTPVTGTTYTVKGLTNGSPYYFTVRAVNGVGTSAASNEATATPQAPAPPAPTVQGGYNLVATDGGVFSFGDAGFFGSAGNIRLNQPVVGMARTPDHAGYWLVARDGGIFSYGDATFEGSAGGIHLNQPIVGMAATPDGHGYWLVARDGGIFTYGDASYYGSAGGTHLAAPVVGMAASADGHGYWEVLADGQVYSFGDAGRFGSVTGPLNHPIIGMAATPDSGGYWLAASDGGVFSFGDARFEGSAGGIQLNQPIVGMAATADGHGYWLVARDGGIFTYGDAGFHGSTGGTHLNAPIVGMGA